jgi:hypothetical protein
MYTPDVFYQAYSDCLGYTIRINFVSFRQEDTCYILKHLFVVYKCVTGRLYMVRLDHSCLPVYGERDAHQRSLMLGSV